MRRRGGLWCSLCERSIRVGFPAGIAELVFCPRCVDRMYLRDEARRLERLGEERRQASTSGGRKGDDVSEPIHALAPADLRRYGDLSLQPASRAPEHSSTVIGDRCYWHLKRAHLEGKHVPLEARQWCGFDLPESDPGWSEDRWHSAEDVLRTVAREGEEREAQVRGIRWLVDLDGTERELSV